jgi:Fe-S oxidoreductase/nitrate reductase gamma subunit
MTPTREVFWNIPYHNWMYLLALIAVISLFIGIFRRIRLWDRGKSIKRTDNFIKRIYETFKHIFIAPRQWYRSYRAFFHSLIFWGFIVLFIGTVLVASNEYLQIPTMSGDFYLGLSFTLDLFGILLIIGTILAIFRRYILLPEGLDRNFEDLFTPLLLLLVAISGFLVEAVRISLEMPDFERWSFAGWYMAKLFTGMSQSSILSLHNYIWWIHAFLSFLLIGLLPYLKLSHIFYAPLSIFTHSRESRGTIETIEDIEEQETFGVTVINEFTWKDLLDSDACMRCGRCQEVCPAYESTKPLSPKKVIQDIKKELDNYEKVRNEKDLTPVMDTILGEELWACTTCFACQDICPVLIEHIRKIVDLRRSEVLMEGKFPKELNDTFRNMETNYNPWGIGFSERDNWAEGLEIPKFGDINDAEYLLYVGCYGAFDSEGQKVIKKVSELLKRANVKFGFLGNDELCCGETARRLGNEYLYQILAMENVEMWNELSVDKIITICPHGYNTIKNEYHQFGGDYDVYHHIQILKRLLEEDRVSISSEYEDKKLIYHDSCYLGRYNNLYTEPREIIKMASNKLVEFDRKGRESFCCGAGGGRMWLEEEADQRINELRLQQALEKNPDYIILGCGYCRTMFDDARKSLNVEDEIRVLDIIELFDI